MKQRHFNGNKPLTLKRYDAKMSDTVERLIEYKHRTSAQINVLTASLRQFCIAEKAG